LEQADTLILLDMPCWLCITRVIKRYWQYRGRTRPDMASGCNEHFNWSFLWFIWNYRRTRRQRNLALLEKHRGKKNVIILQNGAEVEEFIASL
jgi:adenylate kinase family enzyme